MDNRGRMVFCKLSDFGLAVTVMRVNGTTDSERLRDYTGRRSEAAFAELAALRTVREGNRVRDALAFACPLLGPSFMDGVRIPVHLWKRNSQSCSLSSQVIGMTQTRVTFGCKA